MSKKLFESTTLGNIFLKNHLAMAPMTRSRAINNIPNELMAEYYAQRAEAGLLITEGVSPSPNGLGYARIPGAYSPAQTEGWKKVAKAVHAKGGRIFMQLMHTGRVSHPINLPEGAEVLAPSAAALTQTQMYTDQQGMQDIPAARPFTRSEIDATIQEYVSSSQNAIAAGFDGIELHGANGYLIEQFIHPATNRREDEYGGSIENRIRFAVETAKAVADAIGKEKVGIRLSPYGVFNEMPPYDEIDETYTLLAEKLSDLGIAYIHLVDHSGMGAPEVPVSIKKMFREKFNGTLILSGNYDAERAEQDLQSGAADLIAIGRPFLANPDLVERYKQGAALNQPKFNLFYTPGPEGYTDYPTL